MHSVCVISSPSTAKPKSNRQAGRKIGTKIIVLSFGVIHTRQSRDSIPPMADSMLIMADCNHSVAFGDSFRCFTKGAFSLLLQENVARALRVTDEESDLFL